MQEVKVDTRIATLTSRSGTITAGGTAQDIADSNENRSGFWMQNLGSSAIWFNFGVTAVASQPSFRLDPGAFYETPPNGCPTGRVSIICATTGQQFSAREF